MLSMASIITSIMNMNVALAIEVSVVYIMQSRPE